MASRHWVGGTGTWNTTAGSKWSTTSGGTGGASIPSSSDDVFFDYYSGAVTVTIATGAAAMNVDCTGFAGTWAGSGDMDIEENLTLDAGMTSTYTGTITFKGNPGPSPAYIRTNGIALHHITIDGASGSAYFGLYDDLNMSDGAILTVNQGVFWTGNGKYIRGGRRFISTSGASRFLAMASSGVWFTESWEVSDTNLTFDPPVSLTLALTWGGAGGGHLVFTGGGLTYVQVVLAYGDLMTVMDSNTYADFQLVGANDPPHRNPIAELNADQTADFIAITGGGNVGPSDQTHRVLLRSTVRGVQRTLTANTTTEVFCADFQDIKGDGNVPWDCTVFGPAGDCGGNTDLILSTPETLYWVDDAGDWSDTAHWAGYSGGPGSNYRFPLPQDTAIFDSNSFTTSSQTVVMDMARICEMDWTGVTNTPTMNKTTDIVTSFGSATLVSGMNLSGTGGWAWGGAGACTFTRAGKNMTNMVFVIDCGGGSVELQDTLVIASIIGVSGTLDANNNDVTIGAVLDYSDDTATKTLTMGSGTWEFTGNALVIDIDTTGLTVNEDTSTILISNTSANAKNINGGGAAFYDLQVNGAGSAGAVTLTGSNTFHDITLDPNANFKLSSGTTTTVTTFSATGTGGNTIGIASSASGLAATLSCASGTINCNYIVLQDSTATGGATFHAGANSTNVSGNTGWAFP